MRPRSGPTRVARSSGFARFQASRRLAPRASCPSAGTAAAASSSLKDTFRRPANRSSRRRSSTSRLVISKRLRVHLKEGRFFAESDTAGAPGVVIIDERLAQRFWPNASPIGRRMYLPDSVDDVVKPGPKVTWLQVVGVVATVKLKGLERRRERARRRLLSGLRAGPRARNRARDSSMLNTSDGPRSRRPSNARSPTSTRKCSSSTPSPCRSASNDRSTPGERRCSCS